MASSVLTALLMELLIDWVCLEAGLPQPPVVAEEGKKEEGEEALSPPQPRAACAPRWPSACWTSPRC